MKKIDLIFDLDGTLWDATKTICLAWQEILNNYKTVSLEEIKSVMGKTGTEIMSLLFPELDNNLQQELLHKMEQNELVWISKIGASLYNQVEETIKELSKEYNLYIVSNCQQGYIESFLNYYKLNDYFKDIECNGNTNQNKSYNIKLIMERNNINNAVYIGDTYKDYLSSKDNNIPFIFSSYGFENFKPEYKYIINSITELKDEIKKIIE